MPTAFPPASAVPTMNAASAVASRSSFMSEPYEAQRAPADQGTGRPGVDGIRMPS
jgi:hypothetical protein